MARVNTIDVGMQYAREATPGVLPAQPVWRTLEPNSIMGFGNTDKKVARQPITNDRQRRKAKTVDRDVNTEFDGDLTLAHFRDFMEGFCYARGTGANALRPTAATSTTYTVPAIAAPQNAYFIYNGSGIKSLVYASGFANPENNGLKVLGAAVADGATSITVAGNVAETVGSTQDVEVAIAGARFAAGDLEVDADGNLICTAADFTALGLTAGQAVHVGGVDALNNFAEAENVGIARIRSVAAKKLVLDRTAVPFVEDDGDGVSVDLLFGQFIRNVTREHSDFRVITTQFESSLPGLGDSGETLYEYATGAHANTLSLNVPLTDKATVKFGFVGLSCTEPSDTRATNAATGKLAAKVESFGTATDIARLALLDTDESGLTTDFKSLTLSIGNGVTGEKVLGTLGPKYINIGNFEVDIEAEVLFTSADVVAKINDGGTVGLYWLLKNGDGGIHFDFPEGTLEGQQRDYKVGESVKLKSKFMSHKDALFGTSIGISLFPVLPQG